MSSMASSTASRPPGAVATAIGTKSPAPRTQPARPTGRSTTASKAFTPNLAISSREKRGGGSAPAPAGAIRAATDNAAATTLMLAALTAGTFVSTNYTLPSASASVRVVVVARDMEVDGKECVLRGEMEFQDITSGQVQRTVAIRRQEFVQLKK